MGKAVIASGGTLGKYEVDRVYNISWIKSAIGILQEQEAKVNATVTRLKVSDDPSRAPLLSAQLAAIRKRIAMLEAIPETKRVTAWCADFSEEVTGEVGTAEVPDDPAGGVNILPAGTSGNEADFDVARDGILHPILGMGPASAWFLRAVMPGVQKYKPMYRYGVILGIDSVANTCNVSLSRTRDANELSVNQAETLANVAMEYLSCDNRAFDVGDEVLVVLDRDWSTPRVVGFKDNPKPCPELVLIEVNGTACVWDVEKGAFADNIPDGSGGSLSFPCPVDDLVAWEVSKTRVPAPSGVQWFPRPIAPSDEPQLVCDPVRQDTIDHPDPVVVHADEVVTYSGSSADPPWLMIRTNQTTTTNYNHVQRSSGAAEGDPGTAAPQDSHRVQPKGICATGEKPDLQPFYAGLQVDLERRNEEVHKTEKTYFSTGTGWNWGTPVVKADYTQDVQFNVKARLSTPISPAPTWQDLAGEYHYAKTEIAEESTSETGELTPTFSLLRMDFDLQFSNHTVVHAYAGVIQMSRKAGRSAEATTDPRVNAGVVSIEMGQDLSGDGYDPNGAPEVTELSDFVKNAIDGIFPTVSVRIYPL